MDTIKSIFKKVVIGFFSLVVLVVALVFLFGEEQVPTPAATEQPSLGTYTIDGDDSLFDGYSDPTVKIWASNTDNDLTDDITGRTIIKKLERATEVELIQRGDGGHYCKVRHQSDEGWLACEWLQKK